MVMSRHSAADTLQNFDLFPTSTRKQCFCRLITAQNTAAVYAYNKQY